VQQAVAQFGVEKVQAALASLRKMQKKKHDYRPFFSLNRGLKNDQNQVKF